MLLTYNFRVVFLGEVESYISPHIDISFIRHKIVRMDFHNRTKRCCCLKLIFSCTVMWNLLTLPVLRNANELSF